MDILAYVYYGINSVEFMCNKCIDLNNSIWKPVQSLLGYYGEIRCTCCDDILRKK